MKVLLVEDYPDGQVSLQKLLELEGYAVECVGTKKDALEHLHTNRYDLILLDLGLPDSDGLRTLDEVHKADNGAPVVILSALDDRATAIEAVSKGAQDYLVKPVDPSTLLERMTFAMARP